ncbi:phage tail length tape measure family protein [Pseudovibrio sp. POLY-S9]|uniref:phage tail length tape measure family protein n=1 Tax=Pseudovibrio sp. POLY-S9 TaxID=1576596 RepID=UPI00070CA1A3|nr:phage tail length tape measure family protein [Pseudovibrio sp. POLY-S9]
MASKLEQKLITTYEARVTDVERQMKKVERAQKKAFNDNQIKRFNKSIGQSGTAAGKMRNTFSQAGRSVAILEGPLGGVSGRLGAVGGALGSVNPALVAAGVAMAAFAAVSVKAVNAFEAFEVQQKRTDAVLKATGFSAGRTSKQLEQLAQGVGLDTLASTTGVRDAIAQLLTFRSVAGTTFDRTIKLSQDLAAVGFGTLSSSAVQLGKALEDPVTGLSALRRVGVSFTQTQKDMIKNFMATGQVAKAQNAILDAVEKQVGGAGAAAGGGLAGAYDGLAESTQILLERWGQQIASATGLTDAIRGIAGAVDEVNHKATLPGQLETTNEDIDRVQAKLLHFQKPTQGRGGRTGRIELLNEELRELHSKRKEILKQIDQESVEAYSSYSKSLKAQELAATERIQSVIAAQQKILETAKKTPLQRVIDTNLSSAGVTADSDEGKRIVDITKRAFAMQTESKARTKVASAAKKQSDKVKEVIKALEVEREQMSMNVLQRRVHNELIKAGSAATKEQKAEIEQLVIANDNWAKKNEKAMGIASFAGQHIQSEFSLITSQIETGNDALDRFVQSMLDAGVQAALFGSGPFGSFFGGGASSSGPNGGGMVAALATMASSFLGFDGGGWTGPGGKYTPKGIVHGDEYVFSKEATRKLGVANLDALHKSAKGFAKGGFVGGPVPMIPKPAASTPQPARGGGGPMGATIEVKASKLLDFHIEQIAGMVVQRASAGLIAAGGQAGATIVQKNFSAMQSQTAAQVG